MAEVDIDRLAEAFGLLHDVLMDTARKYPKAWLATYDPVAYVWLCRAKRVGLVHTD